MASTKRWVSTALCNAVEMMLPIWSLEPDPQLQLPAASIRVMTQPACDRNNHTCQLTMVPQNATSAQCIHHLEHAGSASVICSDGEVTTVHSFCATLQVLIEVPQRSARVLDLSIRQRCQCAHMLMLQLEGALLLPCVIARRTHFSGCLE